MVYLDSSGNECTVGALPYRGKPLFNILVKKAVDGKPVIFATRTPYFKTREKAERFLFKLAKEKGWLAV